MAFTEIFVDFDSSGTYRGSLSISLAGVITGTAIADNIATFSVGDPISLRSVSSYPALEGMYEISDVYAASIGIADYSAGGSSNCYLYHWPDADGTEENPYQQLYQALDDADYEHIIWVKEAVNNKLDNSISGQLVYRGSSYLAITTSNDGDDYYDRPMKIKGYRTTKGDLDEGGAFYISGLACPSSGQFGNFVELDYMSLSNSYGLTTSASNVTNVVIENLYAKDAVDGMVYLSNGQAGPFFFAHCASDGQYGLTRYSKDSIIYDDCYLVNTTASSGYIFYPGYGGSMAAANRCYCYNFKYPSSNNAGYVSLTHCVLEECGGQLYNKGIMCYCTLYNQWDNYQVQSQSSYQDAFMVIHHNIWYWDNAAGETREPIKSYYSGWLDSNNCAYNNGGTLVWDYDTSYTPRGGTTSGGNLEENPDFVSVGQKNFEPQNQNLLTDDGIWIGAIAGASETVNVVDVSTLNDLSSADIRDAVGLASANLDTQLGDIPTNAEAAANKTGYKLAADGWDSLAITEPAGDPDGWTVPQKLMWLIMRFMNKHTSDNFDGIKVHKADDTLSTTQAVTEAAGVKTVGKAT